MTLILRWALAPVSSRRRSRAECYFPQAFSTHHTLEWVRTAFARNPQPSQPKIDALGTQEPVALNQLDRSGPSVCSFDSSYLLISTQLAQLAVPLISPRPSDNEATRIPAERPPSDDWRETSTDKSETPCHSLLYEFGLRFSTYYVERGINPQKTLRPKLAANSSRRTFVGLGSVISRNSLAEPSALR